MMTQSFTKLCYLGLTEVANQTGISLATANEVAQTVAESSHDDSITHKMMLLMLQLAILIFAAQMGGKLASKLKLPSVLGELGAGIIVGPYLLGGLAIPGLFEHGLFPLSQGSLSVSPELYGFATLASIILLFMSGLETDLRMFLRYSVAGSVVGIGGVVFSMALGMAMGPLIGQSYTSPLSLFFGVLCVATSVGITARILSEKRKMDSSEGVTILAGAVIDDVLGIICLAIVMGIVSSSQSHQGGSALDWGKVGIIALKATSVWIIFSAFGLLFAHKISSFLKKYKHPAVMVTASIGLTLALAAIFECAGLAMIIGAYVMGLCLSKTDLKFTLMERLHGFYEFFVPVFFAVMGALVDVKQFGDIEVLKLGLIYAVLAVIAKVLGCALPAMGLNFNWKGALRIGTGMIPRGEVALIIAGLGVSSGILSPKYFGVAIIMTLVTTVVAPPLLSLTLDIPGVGTRKEDKEDGSLVRTVFPIPNPMIKDMIVGSLRQTFINEGYFVVMMDVEEEIYQIRKNEVAFSLDVEPYSLIFTSSMKQVPFIKMAVYENLIDFQHSIGDIQKINTPDEIRHEVANAVMESDLSTVDPSSLDAIIRQDCIRLHLQAKDKEEAIHSLLDILCDAGVVKNRESIFTSLMDREKLVSTGMQDGVALPHCRSEEVDKAHLAIGIFPDGVDFDSLDQKPTQLIALLISPVNHGTAHLQCLAALGATIMKPDFIKEILSAQSTPDIVQLFQNYSKKK